MTAVGTPVRLRLDDKRRTTLPPALLAEAGVGPGADLVARVEGPGRIVLEASTSILGRLQDAVRAGKAARQAPEEAGAGTPAGSLVDQLLAQRAADPSVTRHDADPVHQPDGKPEAGTGSVPGGVPAPTSPRPWPPQQ